jgi:hypothetical protein
MWVDLSKKRVDAVRWQGAQATLFEVTPRAARTAYGALLLYRQLFMEQYPGYAPPGMVLVTEAIDPDLHRICEATGIRVALVPPAEGS